jgi:hypothetical protein
MEFEMQFQRDGHPADRVLGDAHFHVFHVHIQCFSAWDLERTV